MYIQPLWIIAPLRRPLSAFTVTKNCIRQQNLSWRKFLFSFAQGINTQSRARVSEMIYDDDHKLEFSEVGFLNSEELSLQ